MVLQHPRHAWLMQDGVMDASTGDSLISAERSRALTAALWFRLVAVVVIGVAAGFRHTLPAWMREEFVLIALPLFGYNLAALLGRRWIELILTGMLVAGHRFGCFHRHSGHRGRLAEFLFLLHPDDSYSQDFRSGRQVSGNTQVS